MCWSFEKICDAKYVFSKTMVVQIRSKMTKRYHVYYLKNTGDDEISMEFVIVLKLCRSTCTPYWIGLSFPRLPYLF